MDFLKINLAHLDCDVETTVDIVNVVSCLRVLRGENGIAKVTGLLRLQVPLSISSSQNLFLYSHGTLPGATR